MKRDRGGARSPETYVKTAAPRTRRQRQVLDVRVVELALTPMTVRPPWMPTKLQRDIRHQRQDAVKAMAAPARVSRTCPG